MKNNLFFSLLICLCALTSCDKASKETLEQKPAETVVSKPDLVALKAEIQAIENAWADVSNAKNIPGILAFYSDDAVSMPANKPMLVGKSAIEADSKTWFKKSKPGEKVAFQTMDVYGDDNTLTEMGATTVTDAAGKVIYKGKYMAVWQKRDGKWLTIRDIANDDAKEKE